MLVGTQPTFSFLYDPVFEPTRCESTLELGLVDIPSHVFPWCC